MAFRVWLQDGYTECTRLNNAKSGNQRMLRRLKNIWCPENFHLHHRLGRPGSCFEGWYFKLADWHGWPVTLANPGVMGPYSFVPFMECNHGILSMDHALPRVTRNTTLN